MANDASSSLGLRPLNLQRGNVEVRYFTANTAQNLFRFQPVAINNSGQVEVAALADNTQIAGTIIGFLDSNKASLPSNLTDLNQAAFLDSSNDSQVAVSIDPNQLYVLEEDTGGSALTASNVGNTVNFVYLATTGNTTTGIANVVLDRSTVAADSGGIFTIVALNDNINSDGTVNAVGNNGKWVVKINHHQLRGGSLSAAV